MKLNNVRWGWAFAGALAAEATLIAAAFGWVAIYSHLLHPGQTLTFYQEYAKGASPYVSLTLGIPVFFVICRWIGSRAPAAAWATAMALFGIYCLIAVPMMLTADNPTLTAWFAAINFPTKFLGCYWGGRNVMRGEASKRFPVTTPSACQRSRSTTPLR